MYWETFLLKSHIWCIAYHIIAYNINHFILILYSLTNKFHSILIKLHSISIELHSISIELHANPWHKIWKWHDCNRANSYWIDFTIFYRCIHFFQVFCYQNGRKKEKRKQFKRKLKYTGCAYSMIWAQNRDLYCSKLFQEL